MGLILLCVVSAGFIHGAFVPLFILQPSFFSDCQFMLFGIVLSGGLLKSYLGYITPKRFLFVSTIPWEALPVKVTFHLNFHLRLLGPLRNVNRPHKHSWLKTLRRSLPSPLLCSGVCLLATSVQWDYLSFVLVSWCSSVQGLHAVLSYYPVV